MTSIRSYSGSEIVSRELAVAMKRTLDRSNLEHRCQQGSREK